MPRPKSLRADLSAAWHDLYRLWKLPFEAKLEHSRTLIEKTLAKYKNPVVSWSGGKDSTVALQLVREQLPSVAVVFSDPLVEFPQTYAFVENFANKYGLNLHIAKPAKGQSFWEIGKIYGWPIFGKAIASNVERARRTGNLRPQLSIVERNLALSGIHISCQCSDLLRLRPAMIVEKRLQCDLKVVGLRADESRARVRLWADHGDCFYTKRYFSYREGIWKMNPIATWLEKDVWAYHEATGLPRCDLYKMGHRRNGCWTCAMAVRNGQLSRLRTSHPELLEKLLVAGKISYSPRALPAVRRSATTCPSWQGCLKTPRRGRFISSPPRLSPRTSSQSSTV